MINTAKIDETIAPVPISREEKMEEINEQIKELYSNSTDYEY